jgi:cbb3-type cytochrome oxidase subunit 3
MEQGLSFIGLIALLMVLLFVIESPTLFLFTFLVGSTYLIFRSKKKGWNWRRN